MSYNATLKGLLPPVILVAGSEMASKQLNWKAGYTDMNEIIATAWALTSRIVDRLTTVRHWKIDY